MTQIIIPIDASQIPDQQRGDQNVRVAVRAGTDILSQVVSVKAGGGKVSFDLKTDGPVTVAVGPENTDAADLFLRNTPTVSVRPLVTDTGPVFQVAPFVLNPDIWNRWINWCRTFTLTGHVYGQDGYPVPGAQVTAFDAERFWWWSSVHQVGQAVTDSNGYFSINFTWCCGWLGWWWWQQRFWRLDANLVDHIQPILQLNPNLRISPPRPDLSLSMVDLNPQPLPPRAGLPSRILPTNRFPGPLLPTRSVATATPLNPDTLPMIAEKLRAALPHVPEFQKMRLWPWAPWTPWLECDPDIIFKVTQTCGGLNKVILEETIWQAREDVPTNLDVTLTASSDACTIRPNPGQPEGDCFVFTHACSFQADQIGLTCDMVLGGLAEPGVSDRPFTGGISMTGLFGTSAAADFYGLEYRPAQACPNPIGAPDFQAVPPAALEAITRTYFDATLPWPNQWIHVVFSPTAMVSNVGVVTVYEARRFYEDHSPPANWGNALTGRYWSDSPDLIAALQTSGFFNDGPYEFRVIGYTQNADATLTARGPLPPCGAPSPQGLNNNNDFTLYLDNPASGADEPNASIDRVRFNGVNIDACGVQRLAPGAPFSFEIDLTASDSEGFLDAYSLSIQHGGDIPVTLIPVGGGETLTSGGAAQVGPTYADAIGQGAVRPHWSGGAMVFQAADASTIFPRSCAYELILNVYKRNIVGCEGYDAYQVTKYFSFTVLFE